MPSLILTKVSTPSSSLYSILSIITEPSDDEEEEEFLSEDEHENHHEPKKGEKNSRLNVGYKGDRSYVVRGNTVGVFDEKVKYVGTIGNLQTPKGAEFRPDSVRSTFVLTFGLIH